jgi:hypothetical protein
MSANTNKFLQKSAMDTILSQMDIDEPTDEKAEAKANDELFDTEPTAVQKKEKKKKDKEEKKDKKDKKDKKKSREPDVNGAEEVVEKKRKRDSEVNGDGERKKKKKDKTAR